MAKAPGDDEAEPNTAYAAQSDSGSKPGAALSAWSLVIGAAFLLLVFTGLLLI